MKKNFIPLLLLISITTYAQPNQLKITDTEKQSISFIKEGDKILIGFKTPKHQIKNKPSDVYRLSNAELKDSFFVFTKGRIKVVTDSTIIFRERNSLFSATNREMNISKINTIKKLTTANQIFRTVTHTGGILAAGVMLFYSYAAVGGGQGFITGMLEASCIAPVLTSFGRTKIRKKQLNRSRIQVIGTP